jgi:hypothetical protein
LKQHEAQHEHVKSNKKPERFGDKFLSFDCDVENKFDNDYFLLNQYFLEKENRL